MVKIWAKIITDHKIVKQTVFEKNETLTYSHFFDYVVDICYTLDVPTPVILKTHIFNFAKFNHCKFLKRDFVEKTDFDFLLIENIFV